MASSDDPVELLAWWRAAHRHPQDSVPLRLPLGARRSAAPRRVLLHAQEASWSDHATHLSSDCQQRGRICGRPDRFLNTAAPFTLLRSACRAARTKAVPSASIACAPEWLIRGVTVAL